MYQVEMYLRVRHACLVDGRSQRQAAKEFGIDRRTVGKMLEEAVPPGYRREKLIVKPKLEGHREFIDEILESDRKSPPKQRHTAQRILQRLKEERGFSGQYTIVREYVAQALKKKKEMFIPLEHDPGGAQVDFGEAQAIIKGFKKKLHLFIMDIPYSDGCFIKAYEQETTEAFLDGHVSAFKFFGGVPTNILYDNLRIAVARILGNGDRKKTRVFTELQSHYLFKDQFARVGKGNDKGKVENLVGYARRTFMVPLPQADSLEELNRYLESCCIKRQSMTLQKHKESIGERLIEDQKAFLPIPDGTYQPCTLVSASASPSFQEIKNRGG
jgi:transposase